MFAKQYEIKLNKFGSLKWEDKILNLQQNPYVSDCGEFYQAHAIENDNCETEGNEYMVYWAVNSTSENEDEACDWDDFSAVKL